MAYDLEAIEKTCSLFRLNHTRVSEFEVHVELAPESILIFANTDDGEDTYSGFVGTPSHWHEPIMLVNGEHSYKEYDPVELLIDLLAGEVLIAAEYKRGEKTDEWLLHQEDSPDISSLEPDEELRIYRMHAPETEEAAS